MKPDAGDGSGTGHDLADQRHAELAEVALEIAVEMRRVRLLARQGRFAIDDEAARTEEVREERRSVLDRNR